MAYVTQKVKGGKWYAVFKDVHGKKTWKTGYTDKAQTQRLADRLENEARAISLGDVDPQQEHKRIERAKSITDHLTQYKTALQAAGRDKNHVAYTVKDIQGFIDFSATTHAASITRARVDEWVMSLRNAKTDSNRTINRRVGSLQALLKHLHGQGVLSEYVLLKYGKLATNGIHQKRKRRALTIDEIKKLLKMAPADRVDIYHFALLSGARFSAVCELKVSDINFATGSMALKRKTKGGGLGTYVVPIHPTLVPILRKMVQGKQQDDAVFSMMRREQAARMVKDDCKTAGVDVKGIDFHALRHTFITRLALNNVHPKIAQELAGHSSLEMTLGFYTHFQRIDKVQALSLL